MKSRMFASDVWVNVDVYGPQAEIDRLRLMCSIIDIDGETDEPVVDFSELMPGSGYGEEFYTSNMVSRGPHEPCTLDFGFDVDGDCPEDIFEALAAEFPALAFYYSCIVGVDEYLVEGWYNGPPEAQKLTYREMANDYWETCGMSMSDDAVIAANRAIVENLLATARAHNGY